MSYFYTWNGKLIKDPKAKNPPSWWIFASIKVSHAKTEGKFLLKNRKIKEEIV